MLSLCLWYFQEIAIKVCVFLLYWQLLETSLIWWWAQCFCTYCCAPICWDIANTSAFWEGSLLFWPRHFLTNIEHYGSLRQYCEDARVLKLKTQQSSSVLKTRAVLFMCVRLMYSSHPIQRANVLVHFLCTEPLSTLSYLCQSSRDHLVSKCCCLLPHAVYIYWCLVLWWYFTAL